MGGSSGRLCKLNFHWKTNSEAFSFFECTYERHIFRVSWSWTNRNWTKNNVFILLCVHHADIIFFYFLHPQFLYRNFPSLLLKKWLMNLIWVTILIIFILSINLYFEIKHMIYFIVWKRCYFFYDALFLILENTRTLEKS